MIVELEANLKGVGGLNESDEPEHNLSEAGMLMVRSMVIGVTAKEFFEGGKKEVYARELVIVDEPTGRKFIFNVEAKEA